MVDELVQIARLRALGDSSLAALADESGADSPLYLACRELWREREQGAELSVVEGDYANAITLLERGLHVLRYGPDVLRRDRLQIDDVVKLLGAA